MGKGIAFPVHAYEPSPDTGSILITDSNEDCVCMADDTTVAAQIVEVLNRPWAQFHTDAYHSMLASSLDELASKDKDNSSMLLEAAKAVRAQRQYGREPK